MHQWLTSQESSRRAWISRLGLLVVFLAVALLILAVQAANADSVQVTTSGDVVDANGGDCIGLVAGDLPGPDGVVSLREALCAANTNPDTIALPANTYLITKAGIKDSYLLNNPGKTLRGRVL